MVAAATLSESASPNMGMRALISACDIHLLLKPYCSDPTARAMLRVRSTSEWSFSACGVAAMMEKLCWRRKF